VSSSNSLVAMINQQIILLSKLRFMKNFLKSWDSKHLGSMLPPAGRNWQLIYPNWIVSFCSFDTQGAKAS
jgi:hypothetical protein